MTTASSIVPFAPPTLGPEKIAEVVATLESGWLTTGPRVASFERRFADYVGAPHALAVNSCTAALHLSLLACGVEAGDEVVTADDRRASRYRHGPRKTSVPGAARPGGRRDLARHAARATARPRHLDERPLPRRTPAPVLPGALRLPPRHVADRRVGLRHDLSLPLSAAMTETAVDRVIEAGHDVLR